MSDVVDIDALLDEQRADKWTEVKFRGQVWLFGTFEDVPIRLYESDPSSPIEELGLLAKVLTEAVEPSQREAFIELELSAREAWTLFGALTKRQQGALPGESQAS